jgi:hypothetical protein
MRTIPPMPLPVKRAIAKLGADIKTARLRRRISTIVMAERVFISRSKLQKVEQGGSRCFAWCVRHDIICTWPC